MLRFILEQSDYDGGRCFWSKAIPRADENFQSRRTYLLWFHDGSSFLSVIKFACGEVGGIPHGTRKEGKNYYIFFFVPLYAHNHKCRLRYKHGFRFKFHVSDKEEVREKRNAVTFTETRGKTWLLRNKNQVTFL